jgi:hypothetical protein
VVATLRRRWDRGDFLTMIARRSPWEPLAVPIRAPTAGQLANHFGAAQTWVREWRAVDPKLFRLDHKPVGGRIIGSNELPCRVWIDSQQQLWTLLGVTRQARRFIELLDAARTAAPPLVDWMATYPTKVLAHENQWTRLVETVVWIDQNARPDMYLRQIDVPGVDTKFIESHRGILADLLDRQLATERIDATHPPADLAGRYRFRGKPVYVRVRALGRRPSVLGPYSELTLRVDELAAAPIQAETVYVVENEITYLAFPPVDDAVVVSGGGYALPRLQPLRWLNDRQLIYWGDIDTHGFSILNRLRQVFPHARSMLMDRDVLLSHDSQWVREPTPVNTSLPELHPDEAALYRDLVEDTFGPSLRLEQERVRFSAIKEALGTNADPSRVRLEPSS